MSKIYATIVSHDNGYIRDQEDVHALGDIGKTFILEDARVGRWTTSIQLKDVRGWYNSVNFAFTNESGEEVDIYSMPEYNDY